MSKRRRIRNSTSSTIGAIQGLGSAAGAPFDAAGYIVGGAIGGPLHSALSGPDAQDTGEPRRDRSARAQRRALRRANRG